MKTSLIPTEKALSDFVNEAKGLIAKDETLDAIRFVRNHLPENSPKYDLLILLERRYESVIEDTVKGMISPENELLEKNKVSGNLMDFLNILKEEDFTAEGATKKELQPQNVEKPDVKIGKTLYQIPQKMQLKEEVECKIWIAFDLETILQEVEKKETDAVREIRISNVMGVELFTHNNSEAFEISSYDSTEQIIEKGLPTEWTFYVTPLTEGKHPLILRISVIEEIDGEKVHKTKVLREVVQIVTEAVEPLKDGVETKKAAGLVFATPDDSSNKPKGGAVGGSGGSGKGGKVGMAGILKAGAMMALTLFGIYGISEYIGFKNPSDGLSAEFQDWQKVEHSPNPNDVIAYLEKHPASAHETAAFQRLDQTVDSLSAVGHLNKTDAIASVQALKVAYQNSAQTLPRLDINPPKPINNNSPVDSLENNLPTVKTDTIATKNPPIGKQNDENKKPIPPKFNPKTADQANPKKPKKKPEKKTDDLPPLEDKKPDFNNKDKQPPKTAITVADYPHPIDCEVSKTETQIACTEEMIQSLLLKDLNKITRPEGNAIVSFTITKAGVQAKLQVASNTSSSNELDKVVRQTLRHLPKFTIGQNALKKQLKVSYNKSEKKWAITFLK